MGYAVGGLGTSSGHGEVWLGVLVQCYNSINMCYFLYVSPSSNIDQVTLL